METNPRKTRRFRGHSARFLLPTRVLGAFCVCLALLWSCNQKEILPFSLPTGVTNKQRAGSGLKCYLKWLHLPLRVKEEFIRRNIAYLVRGFSLATLVDISMKKDGLALHSYFELLAACYHALGADIVVERIGSSQKKTAASIDYDIDFQVRRRPGSDQADVPLTETDKLNVAQNLRMCGSVTGPVTIGNIAIKFEMEHKTSQKIFVDLVLANNTRPEQFPKLRGGANFHENSARINEFLEQTPGARLAIVGVKEFFPKQRPKGILLEAIVWRLSETYPLRTNQELNLEVVASWSDVANPLWMEFFRFFVYFIGKLQTWEQHPFGSDLRQDLDRLPEKKQHEYLLGFEEFQQSQVDLHFECLTNYIFFKAIREWTPAEDGPYSAFLERKFLEFFPFD